MIRGCARVQVTYKKLLNGTPTFADLQDAQPGLAKGLQALLDYAGDDVADVFSQTFEVEYRLFDTVRVPSCNRCSVRARSRRCMLVCPVPAAKPRARC